MNEINNVPCKKKANRSLSHTFVFSFIFIMATQRGVSILLNQVFSHITLCFVSGQQNIILIGGNKAYTMSNESLVSSIEISFNIFQGKNLVAKDRNVLNQKTTSDVSTVSLSQSTNIRTYDRTNEYAASV